MNWGLTRAARVSCCRRGMSRRRVSRARAVTRSCGRPTARCCSLARRRGATMRWRLLVRFRSQSAGSTHSVGRLRRRLRARPRALSTLPPPLPSLRRRWHNPTRGPARGPRASPLQLGSRRVRPAQGARARRARGFGLSCADGFFGSSIACPSQLALASFELRVGGRPRLVVGRLL